MHRAAARLALLLLVAGTCAIQAEPQRGWYPHHPPLSMMDPYDYLYSGGTLGSYPYFSGARTGAGGGNQQGRFDGVLLSNWRDARWTTVTSFTTSVTTTTCTASTTACSGRRRRAIIADLLNEEPIAPSAVNPVEETQLANLPGDDSSTAENHRNGRQFADPRFLFQDQNQSGSLFGGLQSSVGSTGLPFNGGLLSYLDQLSNNGIQQQPGRYFLTSLLGISKRSFTVMSTLFSVSTVTSTFACSVASGFGQCPVNGRR